MFKKQNNFNNLYFVFGLVVSLLAVLFLGGCGGSVAGPMTVSEAMESDLRGVTVLYLIAEDYDATERNRIARSGFVSGTRMGLLVIGYTGDFELQDKNGLIFGGVKNGDRWVQ